MSSLSVVKHLQRSITLFTHLSSEGWLGPLLRSFVVPKNVQNKSWLEELWSITKSNKNPFSQNQRSVKIEVNKFWVEPRTPEKHVRLHPFIGLGFESRWSEPGGGSSLVLMALRWTPGLRLGSGALATVWGGTWPCLTSAAAEGQVKWINLSEILICLWSI